jgi:hypothetical protein
MTAHLRLIPGARPSATVAPIHADTYTRAMAGALSAGLDWPRKLRHAQVLSTSPDPRHRRLAEHIRDANELAAAGLLKPAVLDLTPDMRARGKVTVVSPPPYSAGPGTIRRVIIGALVFLAAGWLGLAGVMVQ